MRDIRFRLWDIACNSYVKEHWKLYLNGGISISDTWGTKEDVVLEQYTGLKDKNGKEIYEGDIIKVCKSYYREYLVPVKWDDENCFFGTHNIYAKQIKNPDSWDKKHNCVGSYGFCMNHINQLKGGYNHTSYSYKDGDITKTGYDFEVIGNIHQNKNLLDSSTKTTTDITC